MDGGWFDVDVSDKFLFVCKQKELDNQNSKTNKRETRRTILIIIKVAVKCFNLLRSFYPKESVDFMPHSLQICTRGWHSTNVN
jgi:hypothetical protein